MQEEVSLKALELRGSLAKQLSQEMFISSAAR